MDNDQSYICQICYQLPKNCFECAQCSHLFCQRCQQKLLFTQNDKCPTCRKQNPKFIPAKNRQLINKIKKQCLHCKKKLPFSSLDEHMKNCQSRKIICRQCKKQMKIADITHHTITNHQAILDKIMLKYHESNNSSYAQVNQKIFTNLYGRKVHLGVTGKFYCGGQLQTDCNCCNGSCGPTNGQNCKGCMKLDIQRRGLSKGLLVNARGNVCWLQNNIFYCGKMLDSRVNFCKDDSQCINCKNTTKSRDRYKQFL